MAFQCTIVTPDSLPFDQPVDHVVLPAHDGLVGILSRRAPLLVRIGTGHLRIDGQDVTGSWHYFVSGGVAQMRDNRLTILTHEAIAKPDISLEEARAELAAAEALPRVDPVARERAIARAKAKVDIASL